MIKKRFNKELVMTKKHDENFKSCTICWICDHAYGDADLK